MPRSTHPTRPFIRYLVALAALTCGLYFSVTNSDRGWLVPQPGNLFADPPTAGEDYDLQALNILNRALLRIKENYVEPERIDPQRMLAYALDSLQEEIPQVVAHFDVPLEDGPTEVDLQVDQANEVFEIDGIESPWEMSFRLREIFRFVQENLDDEDVDLRLVEYAAINGMLDTLDPHSVLLSPEVFEEMQANNRGSFGGLGIVISIRGGDLTIISPIDDTPAHRAGLRAGDIILKIGEESTINMTIEEAVSRLRGDPGTAVDIDVLRDGWSVPHQFNIVREIISIQSVESEILGDGIGYVEISNFQANTHDDLVVHLDRLREEMGEIRGLVLDLRNNPGGLLDQAIQVSDTFLDDGTIVTTVGEGARLREERKATEEGTEPFYPIVVLVNHGSASASEIVAGALQNHGRAMIVGERTFGKGSVQVLYEFLDGSALKLTIAQYLTPGDISIQSVGIVPDVAFEPMMVLAEAVDIVPNEHVVREGDLDSHLDSALAIEIENAAHTIQYYYEPEPPPDSDTFEPPVETEGFEPDFEIDVARRLLVACGESWETEQMLELTESTRTDVSDEQLQLVIERFAEFGVDWSEGSGGDLSLVELEVTTNFADATVPAGGDLELTLTAVNHGSAPIYRLQAVSSSDYYLLDQHEFVFGILAPGETRSWSVPIEVPIEENSRYERVEYHLHAGDDVLEDLLSTAVVVEGRSRPHFGFGYQVIDDEGGNGDGLLQLNEDVVLRLTVSNVGEGYSEETLVYVKNEVESAILLEHGRETWEDGLDSGNSRSAGFRFTIQHNPDDDVVILEATVYDTVFREFTSQELTLPVAPDGPLFRDEAGLVIVGEGGVEIRAGADEDSPLQAIAEAGDVLVMLGRAEDWVRVSWQEEAFGWVMGSSVQVAETAVEPTTPLERLIAFQPPMVILEQDFLTTDASTYQLSGVATDDHEVADYYIWVSGLNEDGDYRRYKALYERGGAAEVPVTADIPLYPGGNRISVIVRDADGMSSSAELNVFRRTAGETLSNAPIEIEE